MYIDQELLRQLKDWRQMVADSEGVPIFRVLSNATLENIALVRPRTREELLTVKGIAEKKADHYGEALLMLVQSVYSETPVVQDSLWGAGTKTFQPPLEPPPLPPLPGGQKRQRHPNVRDTELFESPPDKAAERHREDVGGFREVDALTISAYLDSLNRTLGKLKARVQGEISSVDIRDTAVYFTLKDATDGSQMSCIMWRSTYRLNGVEFEAGTEIIVEGSPDIYKPTGRLSFKVSSAELVGEGALKKQYEKLRSQLTAEGIFDPEKKRPLPDFPQKIGLITSREGAAIGDFQVNLGRHGFHIELINSRVEGQSAVPDLLTSIKTFATRDIELLVIIRGGGSMESLLPFNNEVLVREVARFPVPVLVGVGHERDISLVALAADRMVSTPTAAAQALNAPWHSARADARVAEHAILTHFARALESEQATVDRGFALMRRRVQSIFEDFARAEHELLRAGGHLHARIAELKRHVHASPATLVRGMRNLLRTSRDSLVFTHTLRAFKHAIERTDEATTSLEKQLDLNSPERQLRRGYSIVRAHGRIVRRTGDVAQGEKLEIRVQDGTLTSAVTDITPHD